MSRLTRVTLLLGLVLLGLHDAHGLRRRHVRRLFNAFFSNFVAPETERPLDLVDKLYSRLDNINCELKSADEQLTALEAQLSLLNKLVIEIETITLEGLMDVTTSQNALLDDLGGHLDTLDTRLGLLDSCATNVNTRNQDNAESSANRVLKRLSETRKYDAFIERLIAGMQKTVEDFKEKLVQEFGNEFSLIHRDVAAIEGDLSAVRNNEAKRRCETGVVVIDADDHRAEHLFQNSFDCIPQVYYSLSCYSYQLNALTRQPFFGWDRRWFPQPNAIGVFVSAYASQNGVTFEKSNLSFGSSANQKVCVSFQACTIGTGQEPPRIPSTTEIPWP